MVHSLEPCTKYVGSRDNERRRVCRRLLQATIGLGIAILSGSSVMTVTQKLFRDYTIPEFLTGSPPSTEPLVAAPELVPKDNGARIFTETKPVRRLEFIHIPKTGGTSIEDTAALNGVRWGRCHFTRLGPCRPKKNGPKLPRAGCNRWHAPTPFWEHVPVRDHPYRDADLFAIIRNPYTRLLSEYYWPLLDPYKKKLNYSIEVWNDPKHLNEQVHNMLGLWMEASKRPRYPEHLRGNMRYYARDCHLIPQYDYVFHPNGTQLIRLLLRFESLHADFQQLMREYELPLNAPTHDVRGTINRTLTVSNLTVDNLALIERMYNMDFETFGYEKLSSKYRTG